jgi:hypothetical protein
VACTNYDYVEGALETRWWRHCCKINAGEPNTVSLLSNLNMPLKLPHDRSTVFIRQSAFEEKGLSRSAIDERYTLTDEEFRVEAGLVAIGPLPSADLATVMIEELEQNGLVYFDDFFELSGNWPDWLTLHATKTR